MSPGPSRELETFPNPEPSRNYEIRISCPEFTCLCPRTGQPDFATVSILYIPDKLCIELKSLKQYLWSYRETGVFHEEVTNRILDDLVVSARPRYLEVEALFNVRGGLTTRILATHGKRPD